MQRTVSLLLAGVILTICAMAQSTMQERSQVALQAAMKTETVDGDLKGAIEQYKKLVQSGDRVVAAKALLHLGQCYDKLGAADSDQARKAYERVVRDFAEQKETVAEARKHLAPDAGMTQRLVLTTRDWDGDLGKPSHDGRYLSATDGDDNLVVHDLVTGAHRSLTNIGDSGEDSDGPGIFSPDGKLLAYGWNIRDNNEIRVIGADGTHIRTLVSSKQYDYVPQAWFPDGKRILFWAKPEPGQDSAELQLAVVNSADRSVQVIWSKKTAVHGAASLSPDGRYVVFCASDGLITNSGLTVMHADGTGVVALTKGPSTDRSPVFTPDGRKVLFVSDQSGTTDLWSVAVLDGHPDGTPEVVKANIGPIDNLAFTRDGSFYFGIETAQWDIYTAELDPETGKITSHPQRLNEQYVGSSTFPVSWSPDGKSLAYTRVTSGSFMPRSFVVWSATTHQERELQQAPSGGFGRWILSWFPDGRSLLTMGRENDIPVFWRVDARSGEGSMVMRQSQPGWWWSAISSQGKFFYWRSAEPAGSEPGRRAMKQLVARDLQTGEEHAIYQSSANWVNGTFASPDGTQVAFGMGNADGSFSIVIANADGTPAREIYHGKFLLAPAHGVAWTKDQKHLLIVGQESSGPGPGQIYSLSVETGKRESTGVRMNLVSYPSIHPDGNRLAFAGGHSKQELWVVKNVLSTANHAAEGQ